MLEHYSIRSYFEKVEGLDNHRAESKVERGIHLVEDNGIKRSKTVLIGDTIHDYDVAPEGATAPENEWVLVMPNSTIPNIQLYVVQDGFSGTTNQASPSLGVITYNDMSFSNRRSCIAANHDFSMMSLLPELG